MKQIDMTKYEYQIKVDKEDPVPEKEIRLMLHLNIEASPDITNAEMFEAVFGSLPNVDQCPFDQFHCNRCQLRCNDECVKIFWECSYKGGPA